MKGSLTVFIDRDVRSCVLRWPIRQRVCWSVYSIHCVSAKLVNSNETKTLVLWKKHRYLPILYYIILCSRHILITLTFFPSPIIWSWTHKSQCNFHPLLRQIRQYVKSKEKEIVWIALVMRLYLWNEIKVGTYLISNTWRGFLGTFSWTKKYLFGFLRSFS